MSERKRSSLRRTDASASSFSCMVAPTIRITKTSTTAPTRAKPRAWFRESSEGTHPRQRPNWATRMHPRLQNIEVRHTPEPPNATFSSAKNAKAPHRMGPHPVR